MKDLNKIYVAYTVNAPQIFLKKAFVSLEEAEEWNKKQEFKHKFKELELISWYDVIVYDDEEEL